MDGLKWYLEQHMKILGCLDRLETFDEIHKGGYNDDAFASFRESDISSIAMAYAASGNVDALQVCNCTSTIKRLYWTTSICYQSWVQQISSTRRAFPS